MTAPIGRQGVCSGLDLGLAIGPRQGPEEQLQKGARQQHQLRRQHHQTQGRGCPGTEIQAAANPPAQVVQRQRRTQANGQAPGLQRVKERANGWALASLHRLSELHRGWWSFPAQRQAAATQPQPQDSASPLGPKEGQRGDSTVGASVQHAQNKHRKHNQTAHRKPIIEWFLVLCNHPPIVGFAREDG